MKKRRRSVWHVWLVLEAGGVWHSIYTTEDAARWVAESSGGKAKDVVKASLTLGWVRP